MITHLYNINKETNPEKLVSLNDCMINITGNVDREKIIKNLGSYFSYKILNKNIFKKEPIKFKIEIILPKPLYLNELYFDGGDDSITYNSTILSDISCLNNTIWKTPNFYDKFLKIILNLHTSGKRNVDNIIKSFFITFKD